MACEILTKEIDGITYSVTQLPPSRAILLGLKLTKIMGPSFKQLKNLAPEALAKGDAQAAKMEAIGEAFCEVISTTDENVASELIDDLVKMSQQIVNGKPVSITNIDAAFAKSGPMAALMVAAFVVEANFKSFLPAWVLSTFRLRRVAAPEGLETVGPA